jgi:hypothetical protein
MARRKSKKDINISGVLPEVEVVQEEEQSTNLTEALPEPAVPTRPKFRPNDRMHTIKLNVPKRPR